ncbi:unnamed protein product [Adineta steineri]|uniref:Uncharacterized protein n=1 Tax=Adineta steineri TaxID=433720 RepID=A0A814D3D7_9BILA|nr:unnamed protein product [Adineta steineri]CAF0955233.1 unnamed protein product [Adineta steineri]CAF0960263.1 unnamed protein product [Adineta steineri]
MTDSTIKNIATVSPITAEALKPEGKSQENRIIIKDFSLNTSTHGIPGIARSESIPNRLFWSISFISFLGIMLYFINQSILTYYSYPTQTLVSLSDEWPQAFPTVTICNYSPFRYDKFISSFLNYTNPFNLTNTTDTTIFTEQQSLSIPDYLQYKLNRNESLTEFYYPLSSMLIKCVYNGENCSSADFVEFISPTYAVSIVTMVHDNTQLSLIERVGIQMVPGRKHKLESSKKTNSFLPSPYTTCSKIVTPGMQAMFDQFSVAMQTYTYDQCDCVSPYQWSARYIIPHGANNIIYANLCNISDSCYSNAADRFQGSLSISNDYAANCGLECNTNEYVLQLSSGLAPSLWYMNSIKEFVESSSIPLPLNCLDIVCGSTLVQSYTQQATLQSVDLISNIGGQTGLWIGISFLSLMEFAEMIFRLIRRQVYLIKDKIQKRRNIYDTKL